MSTIALFILIVAASVAAASGAVLYFSREQPQDPEASPYLHDRQMVYLFDEQDLVDATDVARRALSSTQSEGSDLARLAQHLKRRFPTLLDALPGPTDFGISTIEAAQGDSRVEAERIHGMLRISVIGEDVPVESPIEEPELAAVNDELAALRTAFENLPYLVWKEDTEGKVCWVNKAYLSQVSRVRGEDAAGHWPPPRLFDTAPKSERGQARMLLEDGDGKIAWFDHSAVPLGREMLHMAAPIDRLVRAETSLKEFLQTLTKTFSHLTIGLAIFDRSRKLVLFNPALTELTHLDSEFLCRRPKLDELLDSLREKRMMPEPKDYKTWRQRIADLESAAEEGSYVETWTLPGGQTYRVSGRPHPDGAIAFLFEDISAEISLTRRFRTELATSQAVIDSLDEAIAVFSQNGVLTLSNRAYADLWGLDPSVTLGQIGVTEATRHWSDRCAPNPLWGDIRNFVGGMGERTEWSEQVARAEGGDLICRILPIAGGGTLVGFAPVPNEAAHPKPEAFRSRRLMA